MYSKLVLSCLLVGLAGSVDAATVKPFSVYDNRDELVGLFYPPSHAQMQVGGKRYLVMMQSSFPGQLNYIFSRLFFRTTDCSGQAHVNLPGDALPGAYPLAAVRQTSEGILLYPVLGNYTTPAVAELRSDGVCEVINQPYAIFPVGEPMDITSKFKSPFKVE